MAISSSSELGSVGFPLISQLSACTQAFVQLRVVGLGRQGKEQIAQRIFVRGIDLCAGGQGRRQGGE